MTMGRSLPANSWRSSGPSHRGRHAAARTGRRLLAQLASVSLLVATIVVPVVADAPSASAAAASTIGMAKTGPGSVLAGSPVAYSLSATNPSGAGSAVQEYNVSFRDVLPAGVDY